MRTACSMWRRAWVPAAIALLPAAVAAAAPTGDPWADEVILFDAGDGARAGYEVAASTLGAPERYTGEGLFPSVVSPFNAPWLPDEIVSLGAGGVLVVRFDEPVTDDPGNPWGIDFLIFGNTGFIDGDYPAGIVDGVFSDDGGTVEVSADGRTWVALAGSADALFPTLGYADAGPYDVDPGRVLTDFTRPVDPALRLTDLLGFDAATLADVYEGSGGGAGFDLAGSGLVTISFVRIGVPGDSLLNVEIDAFADVRPDLPADLDDNGVVDGADLGLLLAAWGTPGPGDLDGNVTVDGADLGLLLAAFTGA